MAARTPQDAVLTGAIALVAAVASAAGWLDGLERFGYDQHFRRPAMAAASEAVIVALDSSSRQQLGPWPWPEAAQSRLLARLQDARLVVWPLVDRPGPAFIRQLHDHGRVILALDEASDIERMSLATASPGLGLSLNQLTPDPDLYVRSVPFESGTLAPVGRAVVDRLSPGRQWPPRQWVNFLGPEESVPVVSAAALLAEPSAAIAGKIVFIGAHEDRLYGRVLTPTGPMAPVTFQAQATLSALHRRDLQPPPRGTAFIGAALAAMTGVFLWRSLPLVRSLLAVCGVSLTLELLDAGLFAWGQRWLPWPTWLMSLWMGYLTLAVAQQVAANRQLALVMDQLLTSYRERKSRHAFTTGPLQRMRPRPLPEAGGEDKVALIGEIARTFHQERSFFQMLLESHHQPVLVVDGDAKVFVCNQAGQGLLGQDVIGKSVFDLLTPLLPRSTVDELQLAFHRAWLSGNPHQRFLTLVEHTFRLNLVPTDDVEGMLCLLDDVTALHERANTDALTGLWNRRFFDEQMETEMARSRRYKDYHVSLLLIDVDLFKRFNDDYGHLIGDRVLQTVANVIKGAVRTTDFAVRYGGEEMAILLTHTDEAGAMIFAERLRARVADMPIIDETGKRLRQVTVSIGVATMAGDVSAAALLARTDGALYASKRNGRNLVTLAPAPSGRARPDPADSAEVAAGEGGV